MSPFELSGPAFLSFFVIAGLCAAGATLALRWLAARPLRRGDPAAIAGRLHPTEVAFLVRDLERAVEAAVAGLYHRGLIEIDGSTLGRVVASRSIAPGEIESHGVYRGVAAPGRRALVEDFVLSRLPATMQRLCEEARGSHLVVELEARLEDADLLVHRPRAAW